MLKILDEKVKTSCYDMADRYPDCRYLYIVDSLDELIEHEGYLYCVSDSNDSFSELVDEECKLREQGILCVHAGSYNNGGGIGVQYEVSEAKV
ncbi:MAG: hypothetical protein K2N89_04955 [Lachnospiraceae bacterium]|nr:hypothetical protein [Lachnospiraceae bacterium]